MDNKVVVYEIKEVHEEYIEPINTLLGQLSSSPHLFTLEMLDTMVHSGNSHLLLAEADGAVVGMLTLCDYLAPTGRKMWIEDVVVDEATRGRSIGRLLVESAIELAKSIGPGTLMLTSRPSREAANALYRSSGFIFKETNNYKMEV